MILSLASVILSLGLIICGCARGNNDIRNVNSQGTTVVCFGDSLTEGVGASIGEDYPSILARGLSYPVINSGRRGDTSADALARVEADVLAHNPRLVVILLGGNDFLQRIPVSTTRIHLEEIIRRIQEGGAMVVLVGLRLGLFTDEYGPLFKEMGEQHRAFVVTEALKGILSNPQLRSDTIHPNAAGYRILAEKVLHAIKPLLAESGRNKS